MDLLCRSHVSTQAAQRATLLPQVLVSSSRHSGISLAAKCHLQRWCWGQQTVKRALPEHRHGSRQGERGSRQGRGHGHGSAAGAAPAGASVPPWAFLVLIPRAALRKQLKAVFFPSSSRRIHSFPCSVFSDPITLASRGVGTQGRVLPWDEQRKPSQES